MPALLRALERRGLLRLYLFIVGLGLAFDAARASAATMAFALLGWA